MLALYRTDELRTLEAHARAALPPGTLMQRAGAAAAAAIVDGPLAAATAGAATVLVLCGPGGNGGDGFRCAAELQARGHHCLCWAPLPSTGAEAQAARQHWEAMSGRVLTELPDSAHFALVVDALLGIGAVRPLEGVLLAALHWVARRGLPVVALDVPSGLDADTGTWIGGVAGATALLTVTFLGDKPGLHLRDGLRAAGRVRVETLDAGATGAQAAPAGRINAPDGFAGLLRRRAPDVNKGSFGSVSIVGGAGGMVGAALLAGRAALRLGAGKVFVDSLGAPDLPVDLLYPELMLQPGRTPPPDEVLVIGCGLGSAAASLARLAALLDHAGPTLFDADALNALARDAGLRARLRARPHATVLTPHPGEAARLLQTETAAIQADRIGSALRLAADLQAIVVLKGAASVIADAAGHYRINPTGNPALASAGTGDVLAGMAGALMAQCADALQAVSAAVWLHGRAAELHDSDVGLTASDIAVLAARAWEQQRAAFVGGIPPSVIASPLRGEA